MSEKLRVPIPNESLPTGTFCADVALGQAAAAPCAVMRWCQAVR